MNPILLLTALLMIIAASCGEDGAAATTVGVTTTAPTPSAATTITPTTTTPTAPFTVDPNALLPDVFGSPGDPHGSGCVALGMLPDGVWFGFADSVTSSAITFDPACFFTGDAAVAQATIDGEEAFDFYIRNQSQNTFTVSIAPTADVFIVDGISIEPRQTTAGNWPSTESYGACPGEYCAIWLYVNGGVATGIVEQYLP